ncbi:hypothetical protein ACH5A3_32040 [Streptomyces echinatus]|uniref:hypothetical protein n=1 Tax=Streptomyces echinatus TaxID=67293 RepID=UPI0037BDE9DD
MTRHREVYYLAYEEDFGLSGFGGRLGPGGIPVADPPAVLAMAAETARAEEDGQLGRDVRLLLESPVPEAVVGGLWPALTGGRFDPGAHGLGARDWLRMIAQVCPAGTPDQAHAERMDTAEPGPAVPEEELRESVRAEIGAAAPALAGRVPLPDVADMLRRIVDEADADLGFRLFLRVLKANAASVGEDQYERLLGIGDRLAYPHAAVFEDLTVRWRPLDANRRDLGPRAGLPFLSAMFDGEWDAWRYEGSGTPHEHIGRLAHGDRGIAPGTQAAVLLQDVRLLSDSALSDDAVTALWRIAARRSGADETFDADGRAWLREIAEVCTAWLAGVAPSYVPGPPAHHDDLRESVLHEVRDIGPALDQAVARQTPGAPGPAVTTLLRDTVTSAGPDLGFRLLLHLVDRYEVTISRTQYDRYREIGARLGLVDAYIDQVSPHVRPL